MERVREARPGVAESIIWRGDDGYEHARADAIWHARVPERYPDGVLEAQSEQEVIDAVRYARERGLKVKARAGGHSWTASSVRDGGLLIDLAGVNDWSIDPINRSAEVQPGAKGRDLNQALADHGLFFPTGHCPTIALGGFLLQGGWGWNCRALGPSCFHVTGVDVVTADGELVHADEQENPDLLWAARGAGSGFFGIVTRYYLSCSPRPKSMMRSLYVYSFERLTEIMNWAHDMRHQWPRELELQIMGIYPREADSSPVEGADPVLVIGAFALADTDAQCEAALTLLESNPARKDALEAEVCIPATLDELYEVVDQYARPHASYSCDSMWSDAPREQLVGAFVDMVTDLPTPYSYVLWWPWAPQDLPEAALSITGEHYISPFAGWRGPEPDDSIVGWPVRHVRKYDHLSKGIQLADENLLGHPDARYMTDENGARLEQLRSTWDPDGLFHGFLFGEE